MREVVVLRRLLLQTLAARASATAPSSIGGATGRMQAAAAAAAAGAGAAPRALLPPPSPVPAALAAAAAFVRSGGGPCRHSSFLTAASRAPTAAAAPEQPPPPPKRRGTRAVTTKAAPSQEEEEQGGSAPPPPRARRTTKKTADGEAAAAAPAAAAAAAAKPKRASKTKSASAATSSSSSPPSLSSSAFYGPSSEGGDEGDEKASTMTFASLGLHPLVCAGLERGPLALARPSRVQRLSAPALLGGGDVVLAAETGSGKTLAYLAPLATALLRRREARRAAEVEAQAQADGGEQAAAPPPRQQQQQQQQGRRGARVEEGDLLLVLCPNAALCEQVMRAAHAIAPPYPDKSTTATTTPPTPLLRATFVSSAKPPPFEAPDLAVATPSGLAALLRAAADAPGGPPYGALWTAAGLGRAVGAVVVDEADLMLSGGYSRDLAFLLDVFKTSERRAAEARAARLLGLPGGARELSERLPAGGARARDVRLALWSARGDLVAWAREMDRLERERDEEEGAGGGSRNRRRSRSPPAKRGGGGADADANTNTNSAQDEAEYRAATARLRRLLRLRDGDVDHRASELGEPWAAAPTRGRQHVFVAATMPALTKADAGTELEARYRGARWVRGDLLHRALPGVGHAWVPIAPAAAATGAGAAAAAAAASSYSSDDDDEEDDDEDGGGRRSSGRRGGRQQHKRPQSDEEVEDARYASAWEAALARAVVGGDEDWVRGRARVLVFARDARRAEAAAAVVQKAAAAAAGAAKSSSSSSSAGPFEVHSYHKGVPADEREAALEAMRRPLEGGGGGEKGGGGGSVAVACTDAAARGLDLPLVTHVVQADFAGNASDFLHRVGRTARAGREGGKVTSIYRAGAGAEDRGGGNEAVLARALEAAVGRGEPIEGAFSRNRSFARKVKRYGGYVARGEAGVRPTSDT